MKKVFSIFLVFCAAFAYADDQLSIEEVDDQECGECVVVTFAESPIFEDDEVSSRDEIDDVSTSSCDECGCGDECSGDECRDEYKEEGSETAVTNNLVDEEGKEVSACFPCVNFLGSTQEEENGPETGWSRWTRYKVEFKPEIIYIRFPTKPVVKNIPKDSISNVYAFDNAVMYSFVGYNPPCSQIALNPKMWFDQILHSVSQGPYTLISQSLNILEGTLEYETYDVDQNMVLKGKAIVTPCNGYILQCMAPVGIKDEFVHFVKNFAIKCEYCR